MNENSVLPTNSAARQHGDLPSVECEHKVALCPSARASIELLTQAAMFIEMIDDHTFAAPSRLMVGGTIGKHFRHVVDHFAASLKSVHDDPRTCVVDYDRRERNVPMESCRVEALREIHRVAQVMRLADERRSAQPVMVRVMLSADGAEQNFASTVGREIAFAFHHAVHHHAMISAIATELGVATPTGFGKAPATLNFERATGGDADR